MESIDEIFDCHTNSSILESKPISNPMLEGVEFFNPKILSIRLSCVYHDIFSQHDWIHLGHVRFGHAHNDIVVEVHNKYNTLNSRDKYESLKSLRRLRCQDKIYGCIYDKEPKDEKEDGIRVITGTPFLHFMIGNKTVAVKKRHKYLIHRFYRNVLKPWLRYKLR